MKFTINCGKTEINSYLFNESSLSKLIRKLYQIIAMKIFELIEFVAELKGSPVFNGSFEFFWNLFKNVNYLGFSRIFRKFEKFH